jgi:hypothetical protein
MGFEPLFSPSEYKVLTEGFYSEEADTARRGSDADFIVERCMVYITTEDTFRILIDTHVNNEGFTYCIRKTYPLRSSSSHHNHVSGGTQTIKVNNMGVRVRYAHRTVPLMLQKQGKRKTDKTATAYDEDVLSFKGVSEFQSRLFDSSRGTGHEVLMELTLSKRTEGFLTKAVNILIRSDSI